MEKFTIDQIRQYLKGKYLLRWDGRNHITAFRVNASLMDAVEELEDEEDGIVAVLERVNRGSIGLVEQMIWGCPNGVTVETFDGNACQHCEHYDISSTQVCKLNVKRFDNDRTHVECAECALEKVEPKPCPGHHAGPVHCEHFVERE